MSENITERPGKHTGKEADWIIQMNHITKRFPGIVANDDVTLYISILSWWKITPLRRTLFWGWKIKTGCLESCPIWI